MAKLTPKSSPRVVRKAWVEAMESGKYRKANGALYENGAHCALGVLCDLAWKAKVTTKQKDEYGEWGFGPHYDNAELPQEVREWAGLRTNDGDMVVDGEHTSIPAINDGGRSLKAIAKIIRTCPEGLFKEDK